MLSSLSHLLTELTKYDRRLWLTTPYQKRSSNGVDPLSGEADAVCVAAAVQAREVSGKEVAAAAISRIEERNKQFSFMVADRFERALAEAGDVDHKAPLAGVPMMMKDLLATVEGLPLTEGSEFIRDWIPESDSEYVGRLKQAGAIILGSVTSPELGVLSSCESKRYGVTRNPNAPDRSTAGSSGGSAAAVAAGAIPVAHASDVGGSIRMPASCCGVVGMKPTRGRNPLGPEYGDLFAGAWAEHVITRSVRDNAAFLDATGGPASGDPYCAPAPLRPFLEATECEPRRLRVAVSTKLPDGRPLHPDSAEAVRRVANAMADMGHEVTEGNPEFEVAIAVEDFFTLFSAALAARVDLWSQRLGRSPTDADLEAYTRYLVDRGRRCSAPDLMNIVTRLQRHSRDVAAFFDVNDIWLSPTLGIPSFPLGYLDVSADVTVDEVLARDEVITAFTWIANLTGQPAISYPAYRGVDGEPIGVQLTGRFGDEDAILGAAASLERQQSSLSPSSI